MKIMVVLFTFLLTSCSSIPLATMVHFSDKKPEDFFNVDPHGILVKVSINSAVNFEPTKSIRLSASIEDDNGQRNIRFPLEVIERKAQTAVNGLFNDSPALDIYILKLTPKALANLAILKKERTSGGKKRVGLTAGVNFSQDTSNRLKLSNDTVLSVALKLTEQNEFITLIDNWQVQREQ